MPGAASLMPLAAFAPFFMQDPSFLAFQRRMQEEEARSNCQSLFGIERIPTDNCIRSLLDGCPSDAFNALFPACLDTLAEGALAPFLRLDNRSSRRRVPQVLQDSLRLLFHPPRRQGQDPAYFHSMAAPPSYRVIPLMPEFIGAHSDPAASDASLTGQRQKQDCERKPSAGSQHVSLAAYRPVYLGDACHPICQLLLDHDTDFLFVCKPASHKCLQDFLHESLYHSTGWLRVRNARNHITYHRYRWQKGHRHREFTIGRRPTTTPSSPAWK